uniref:pleckstrin homology domain-containing family O member 2 isoform X2 n=1 Tax=Scatophagus argus TaxID=75038 RepID=UPI001ED825A8|nr:pleckstrin homology domain-containing family O member 2 isoform X2 [Scatophagus argus]
MEDGAKDDPTQCKLPKVLGKAGWIKKAPRKLLASYKDRYIHVEKSEIVVYEKEDLQNCLERLDLENYDKCHELKSPFKKKHRLVLIRSPESGNKVHDVKFQTQTAEEKEAWIKALNEGISRAKNKVFDEVKIDESCNLEHVTRTRPKGNRNRRPPTRIHMKEVAVISSDGILRLDLDLDNALMPNGTHHASVDGSNASKEAIQVPTAPSSASEATEEQSRASAEEEAQTEHEVSPQKKDMKPPMPPIKEAKSSAAPDDEPDKDDGPRKKVLKPPMPPSKEVKPCFSSVEEATEKAKAEMMSEKSPDSRKKTGPPPTPPNKPSSSSSMSNLAEASQSRPNSHPPTPPSKEKKPSHSGVEADEEVPENWSDNEPQTPTEPLEKDPCPLLTTKKEPEKLFQPGSQCIEKETTETGLTEEQDPTALLQTASDTSASSPQEEEEEEEELAKSEVSSVTVFLSDLSTDNLSPVQCLLHGRKNNNAEENSLHSGQHSDDDSDSSGVEDTLAVSTAALRGSHAGLDVLDVCEDDIQISVNLRQAQGATKSQPSPLKPSTKARSASSGDLLSNPSVCFQVRPHTRAVAGDDGVLGDNVEILEAEVSLEMENASELLSRVSQSQSGDDGEGISENLLTKAMEKLKKADQVLREVKKLRLAKNLSNRKSW